MLPKTLLKFKDDKELFPYTIQTFDLAITDESVEYILLEETGEVLYDCNFGLTESGAEMYAKYIRMIFKTSRPHNSQINQMITEKIKQLAI